MLAAKGSLYLTRPSLMVYTASRPELEASARDLFAMVSAGKVSIQINHRYPLKDAADAHRDLEARRSVAVHWGTFILTDEPVDEPPRRLLEARAAAGLADDEFVVMQHGETSQI